MKKIQDHPLVISTVNALREAGHPNPEFWTVGWNETFSDDPNFVRILINQRFRLLLGKHELETGVRSLAVREAMDYDGDIDLWLERFRLITAEHLVKYQVQ